MGGELPQFPFDHAGTESRLTRHTERLQKDVI